MSGRVTYQYIFAEVTNVLTKYLYGSQVRSYLVLTKTCDIWSNCVKFPKILSFMHFVHAHDSAKKQIQFNNT